MNGHGPIRQEQPHHLPVDEGARQPLALEGVLARVHRGRHVECEHEREAALLGRRRRSERQHDCQAPADGEGKRPRSRPRKDAFPHGRVSLMMSVPGPVKRAVPWLPRKIA